MEAMYLHAIYADMEEYDSKETRRTLEKILKSQYLLSLRLQNRLMDSCGFNGPDHIALCDYEKRFLYQENDSSYNAYQGYIRNSVSLIFLKQDIQVEIPQLVDIVPENKAGYHLMYHLGRSKEKRYSDLPDEVQVKDLIPLTKLAGITFPTHLLKAKESEIGEIKLINDILKKYGYNVPIYDIDTFQKLQVLKEKSFVYRKKR